MRTIPRIVVILVFCAISLSIVALVAKIPSFYKQNQEQKETTGYDTGKLHITGAQPYNRFNSIEDYRLRIYGLVDREMNLSYNEITALQGKTVQDPLSCILGWTDKAEWYGPPISAIIRKANPKPEGTFVVFSDNKNYSSSLSMEYIMSEKPILACMVNNETLPPEHGWPFRVVAPGKWGYKWMKWVTEIEITNRGYEGTYEKRGFSLNGDVTEPLMERDKKYNNS